MEKYWTLILPPKSVIKANADFFNFPRTVDFIRRRLSPFRPRTPETMRSWFCDLFTHVALRSRGWTTGRDAAQTLRPHPVRRIAASSIRIPAVNRVFLDPDSAAPIPFKLFVPRSVPTSPLESSAPGSASRSSTESPAQYLSTSRSCDPLNAWPDPSSAALPGDAPHRRRQFKSYMKRTILRSHHRIRVVTPPTGNLATSLNPTRVSVQINAA